MAHQGEQHGTGLQTYTEACAHLHTVRGITTHKVRPGCPQCVRLRLPCPPHSLCTGIANPCGFTYRCSGLLVLWEGVRVLHAGALKELLRGPRAAVQLFEPAEVALRCGWRKCVNQGLGGAVLVFKPRAIATNAERSGVQCHLNQLVKQESTGTKGPALTSPSSSSCAARACDNNQEQGVVSSAAAESRQHTWLP